MSETCYGHVLLARSAFIPTPSITELPKMAGINWPAFAAGYLAVQDLAISNQPTISTPLRPLDGIEQEILHEAHMRSVQIVGGVIRL
jgi:hypothetical protein